MVVRFVSPQTLLHFGLGAGHEGFLRLCFARGGPQNFSSELRSTMQPPSKFGDVLRGILRIAKVREKQA